MRKVSLLFALAAMSLTTFAQYNRVDTQKSNSTCAVKSVSEKRVCTKKASPSNEIKAPGDVFWSEDFTNVANGGDADAGWTYTLDNPATGPADAPNAWVYIDTDTIFGCQSLSGGVDDHGVNMIPGTTPNGYLHLPIQYMNCVPGTYPRELAENTVDIDATAESPWIDLTGAPANLVLKYKTLFILCCSPVNTKIDVNVGVDTDGDDVIDNWTTLNGRDIGGEVAINEWGGYDWQSNISSIVAGAAQMKVAFRFQGGQHYMLSIDDIQIVEPLDNDVAMLDYFAGFNGIYTISAGSAYLDYNANYSEVPSDIQNFMQLGALLHQNGANGENTRVDFSIDSVNIPVWSETSTTTIPNFGSVTPEDTVLYTDTTNGFENAYYFYNNTLDENWFITNGFEADGIPYRFHYNALSDNVDDVDDNNSAVYNYSQTFGRMSYHWQTSDAPEADDAIGPFSYSGINGTDGDIVGNTFELYQEDGDEFKIWGLRVYIPNSTRVTFDVDGNGVTLVPVIYKWDPSAAAGEGDYIEVEDVTALPYQLHTSDTAKFVYMSFLEDEVNDYTFESGDYLVGFSVTYNSLKFELGVDKSYRQGDTHFKMKLAEADNVFYYWGPGGSVMLDIYTQQEQMTYDITGINEVSNSKSVDNVAVYPNPTTGLVKVKNAENATIKVYSIAGNLVKTVESTSVITTLDLTGMAKGTYLVKVVKENEVVTKKINLIK